MRFQYLILFEHPSIGTSVLVRHRFRTLQARSRVAVHEPAAHIFRSKLHAHQLRRGRCGRGRLFVTASVAELRH